MYRTTEEARRAALEEQWRKQAAQGRIISPVVRRFLLSEAPAKELGR